MQLVDGAHQRPGFLAHLGNGGLVEHAVGLHFGRVQPAAVADGIGATLFKGGVVQKGIGAGVDDLLRKGRRFPKVPGDEGQRPALDGAHQLFETLDVHGLGQAVVDGLLYQRVLGHLTLALDVLETGDLIGEYVGHQVLGIHPLELRRHALAIAIALDGQRAGGIPAPAHLEHGGVEQRLHQHVLHAAALQIGIDFLQWKTVHRAQGDHDAVLVRGGLQFEVEGAAEALAQGKTPRTIEATAEGRMYDDVHVAYLVKEALHHQRGLGWHDFQRIAPRLQIIHQLLSGRSRQAQSFLQPLHRIGCRVVPQIGIDGFPQGADRERKLPRAARAFPEPEGDRGPRALGVAYAHLESIHPQQLPAVAAQRENVAGQCLEGEVFVERADHGVVRVQHYLIIEHVRDGAAIGQRCQAGIAAGTDPVVDHIQVQIGALAPQPRGVAVGQHLHDAVECLPGKITVGMCTHEQRVEGIHAPAAFAAVLAL